MNSLKISQKLIHVNNELPMCDKICIWLKMSIHVLNPKAKFPPNIEKESLHEKDDVKD
jgi:DsbC/DsbD-like thiol-disulfide interchange protein